MAKQSQFRIIHPSDATRAIQEYLSRVGALMSIMPNVIDYIEDTTTPNKGLRDKLVDLLKMHSENINEFRNEGV